MKEAKGKKAGPYEVSQLVEGQFEPGSRRLVLKNLLGIRLKREMDRVEAKEQLYALDELVSVHKLPKMSFP